MMTITQADAALKEYYLGVITNQLNNKINPLMARIEQTSENVYGKEVVKLLGCGINGGIGAAEETGELPKAAENNYGRLSVTLKNLYGRIELSDKVIRASRHSSGAFVNMLNSEMEGLLEAAAINLSRMLYGDGSGKLATVASVEGTGSKRVLIFDTVRQLVEGMCVDVVTSASDSTKLITNTRVRAVDRVNKTLELEAAMGAMDVGSIVTVAYGQGLELTGLARALSTSTTIYGVSRTASPLLRANIDSTTTAVSESAIQNAIDCVEEATGDNINFIACSYGVRRALQNHLATYRRNIDVLNLEGGFRALSFNGIPVVADRFCPEKHMYLLNTDYFRLYQLCDWEWLQGENGSVLKQIAGTATYSATLVKYAELVCEKIPAQAVMNNLTEA